MTYLTSGTPDPSPRDARLSLVSQTVQKAYRLGMDDHRFLFQLALFMATVTEDHRFQELQSAALQRAFAHDLSDGDVAILGQDAKISIRIFRKDPNRLESLARLLSDPRFAGHFLEQATDAIDRALNLKPDNASYRAIERRIRGGKALVTEDKPSLPP